MAYVVTDWLSFGGNLGHRWVDAAPSDYTHYDIGAAVTWKSWTLDARYVGTDISKAQCAAFWMSTPHACEGGVVATLTCNIANLLQ